jgi:hypothetical protein
MSDNSEQWNYFQNPTISHYTYVKDAQYHQDPFHDDTVSRDELFSIGPMKWR